MAMWRMSEIVRWDWGGCVGFNLQKIFWAFCFSVFAKENENKILH